MFIKRDDKFKSKNAKKFKTKRIFRKKFCRLCLEKSKGIDYKDIQKLQKFTTERGKILPSRISGNCARHQRMVTRAIKIARAIAFLPYVTE